MNTEATVQERHFLNQTQVIVLAIVGAVALWTIFPWSSTTLALLAVTIIFLLGLRKPVWAIAALLVNTLTINDYLVGTPG